MERSFNNHKFMPSFERPPAKKEELEKINVFEGGEPLLPRDLQMKLNELRKKGQLSDPERREFLDLQAKEEEAKKVKYQSDYKGYHDPVLQGLTEKKK